MYLHALAVLKDAQDWEWPETTRLLASGNKSTITPVITATLLYCLVDESNKLGGAVVDQFWTQFGACDQRLANNGEGIFFPCLFFGA